MEGEQRGLVHHTNHRHNHFVDIPKPNPLFKDLSKVDDGNHSDDDAEPIEEDLFAVVDVEDDIDASSELWDTPGVKAIVNHMNKLARINKERFSKALQKPVPRNPPQPEGARSDPQEVYEFGPGSSAFPTITMEAMRKEYVNFIRQPILFQERVDQDFAVCPYSSQPHETESFTFLCPPRPGRRSLSQVQRSSPQTQGSRTFLCHKTKSRPPYVGYVSNSFISPDS